jgi:hypothetical protein
MKELKASLVRSRIVAAYAPPPEWVGKVNANKCVTASANDLVHPFDPEYIGAQFRQWG